jgi:hypothetical protein
MIGKANHAVPSILCVSALVSRGSIEHSSREYLFAITTYVILINQQPLFHFVKELPSLDQYVASSLLVFVFATYLINPHPSSVPLCGFSTQKLAWAAKTVMIPISHHRFGTCSSMLSSDLRKEEIL